MYLSYFLFEFFACNLRMSNSVYKSIKNSTFRITAVCLHVTSKQIVFNYDNALHFELIFHDTHSVFFAIKFVI